ncbi:HAD family acid phosphatase [Actinosynnema sp. NPDC023587]|uniref:HAD family acid phosphatase n=1 Tax=Actinosynnema sp. NPDC023587 TaxID=3154695 RepID=UPI00340E9317
MIRSKHLSEVIRLALALAVGMTVAGGVAGLAEPGVTVTRTAEPPNLGRAKIAVKEYYGGHLVEGKNQHSDDSQWARDVQEKAHEARQALDEVGPAAKPAIVLDIDDTAEVTYGWQADSDFAFDHREHHEAIKAKVFKPVLPVRELAWQARSKGIKVYFVTGRREDVRQATVDHLAEEGYPEPAGVFLKPARPETAPPYLHCKDRCPTAVFKSLTRKHIVEDIGDTIVVNIGDQDSDFAGEHSPRNVKLPNPMYYLP